MYSDASEVPEINNILLSKELFIPSLITFNQFSTSNRCKISQCRSIWWYTDTPFDILKHLKSPELSGSLNEVKYIKTCVVNGRMIGFYHGDRTRRLAYISKFIVGVNGAKKDEIRYWIREKPFQDLDMSGAVDGSVVIILGIGTSTMKREAGAGADDSYRNKRGYGGVLLS